MKTRFHALTLAALAGGLLLGCGDQPTASLDAASTAVHTAPGAAARPDPALPHRELARLRAATARYHDFEKAQADGYTVELTQYRTGMGFHYLNPALLDDQFELERPEVLMYVPGPNGRMRFVGVEYATPIADLQHPPPPPEGFPGAADVWAANAEFSVWTLHVWVGLENPAGIFAPMNPRLP